MLWTKYLSEAQRISRDFVLPKQHIVVAGAVQGKTVVRWRMNNVDLHAEDRVLQISRHLPIDALLVYRFNVADPTKEPRASCPCSGCAQLIASRGVRVVQFMSYVGVTVAYPGEFTPYRKKLRRA